MLVCTVCTDEMLLARRSGRCWSVDEAYRIYTTTDTLFCSRESCKPSMGKVGMRFAKLVYGESSVALREMWWRKTERRARSPFCCNKCILSSSKPLPLNLPKMANQRIFGAGDKRTVHPAKFLHYTLTKIVLDAHCRLCIVVTSLPAALSSAILLTPLRTVSAQAIAGYGYPYLSSDHPSYKGFVAGPADASDSDGQKVLADVDNAFGRSIHWLAWKHRVDEIRAGDPNECLGNLSIALTGLGGAYDAKSAGATTLLTLLPTAGALIGTPVTELWVLSKLMPLAGVVSALLSLGGNIVPSDVNDYERVAADFTYSGMVASKPDQHETNAAMVENDEGEGEDDVVADMKEAALFARKVAARAKDTSGTRKSGVIAIGIAVQIFLLGLIMVAYWLLQSGSVVVWWCTVRRACFSSFDIC